MVYFTYSKRSQPRGERRLAGGVPFRFELARRTDDRWTRASSLPVLKDRVLWQRALVCAVRAGFWRCQRPYSRTHGTSRVQAWCAGWSRGGAATAEQVRVGPRSLLTTAAEVPPSAGAGTLGGAHGGSAHAQQILWRGPERALGANHVAASVAAWTCSCGGRTCGANPERRSAACSTDRPATGGAGVHGHGAKLPQIYGPLANLDGGPRTMTVSRNAQVIFDDFDANLKAAQLTSHPVPIVDGPANARSPRVFCAGMLVRLRDDDAEGAERQGFLADGGVGRVSYIGDVPPVGRNEQTYAVVVKPMPRQERNDWITMRVELKRLIILDDCFPAVDKNGVNPLAADPELVLCSVHQLRKFAALSSQFRHVFRPVYITAIALAILPKAQLYATSTTVPPLSDGVMLGENRLSITDLSRELTYILTLVSGSSFLKEITGGMRQLLSFPYYRSALNGDQWKLKWTRKGSHVTPCFLEFQHVEEVFRPLKKRDAACDSRTWTLPCLQYVRVPQPASNLLIPSQF